MSREADVRGLPDEHVDTGKKEEREWKPHKVIPPNPERACDAEDTDVVNDRHL